MLVHADLSKLMLPASFVSQDAESGPQDGIGVWGVGFGCPLRNIEAHSFRFLHTGFRASVSFVPTLDMEAA